VALNFRSRSGEPNRTRRFYHSGETGDLAWVLERLARREPGTPVGAVGYSLGGNVLLKYLGERGEDARGRVRAAVAVSVPYRLSESADALEDGLGPLYARFFLRSLRQSVRAKSARHGHEYDLPAPSRVRTLRAFDDAFTAPVHGFDGAEDYYRRSSSARYLPGIRVSTLLLQARNDPFLPADALPEEEMEGNPWLAPGLTDRGGHLGFVEGGTPWTARFWAEAEAARFLGHVLPRAGG
jgi:predicted alpha/beta-fold hydrolase